MALYIQHCGFIITILLYSFDIEEGARAIDPSDGVSNNESKQPPSEKDSECQKDSSDDDLEMGERVSVSKMTPVTLIHMY